MPSTITKRNNCTDIPPEADGIANQALFHPLQPYVDMFALKGMQRIRLQVVPSLLFAFVLLVLPMGIRRFFPLMGDGSVFIRPVRSIQIPFQFRLHRLFKCRLVMRMLLLHDLLHPADFGYFRQCDLKFDVAVRHSRSPLRF
jgi:hypothetical protein